MPRREFEPPRLGAGPPSEELDRTERRLSRRGATVFPHVGDGVERTLSLAESFAELISVAQARAAFYGELLSEQYANAQANGGSVDPDVWGSPCDGADGLSGLSGSGPTAGLIGHTYASAVVGVGEDMSLERIATAESPRALVLVERDERDRAAKLIKEAVQLNIDLQRADLMRGYAVTTSAALRSLVDELGLSMADEPVLRAAKRAGLVARRAVGCDDGDPDLIAGPALSKLERARVLAAAAERARVA